MDFGDLSTGMFVVVAVALLAFLGAAVFFAYRLIRAYPIIRDPEAPKSVKIVFWLAVLYTVSPVDILTDPILADDLLALYAAYRHVTKKGRELGLGQAERSDI